jgi:hypothetical protein
MLWTFALVVLSWSHLEKVLEFVAYATKKIGYAPSMARVESRIQGYYPTSQVTKQTVARSYVTA